MDWGHSEVTFQDTNFGFLFDFLLFFFLCFHKLSFPQKVVLMDFLFTFLFKNVLITLWLGKLRKLSFKLFLGSTIFHAEKIFTCK